MAATSARTWESLFIPAVHEPCPRDNSILRQDSFEPQQSDATKRNYPDPPLPIRGILNNKRICATECYTDFDILLASISSLTRTDEILVNHMYVIYSCRKISRTCATSPIRWSCAEHKPIADHDHIQEKSGFPMRII